MTDRELLERAARAAGRGKIMAYLDDGAICTATLCWPHSGERWDPLNDDGDALRLAVKLRFVVHVWDDGCTTSVAKTMPDGEDPDATSAAWHSDSLPLGSIDPAAATRRAIVRAAASLSDAEGAK